MKYESMTYENHAGSTLQFGNGEGLYVNQSDIRDYSWDYTTVNNSIKHFYRKIRKYTIPVFVLAKDEDAAIKLKNQLLEIADKDVVENEHGKIIIGDYYLPCFVTGSKKTGYSKTDNKLAVKLTVVSDTPYWTYEKTTLVGGGRSSVTGGIDYPHDYAFDFGARSSTFAVNSGYYAEDFRITVYGVADTILVKVGNNTYSIDYALGDGEYAVIDSRAKTAIAYSATGEQTNIFSKRDRSFYLFEKIPVGSNYIDCEGLVNVTLYDERSEPLWT